MILDERRTNARPDARYFKSTSDIAVVEGDGMEYLTLEALHDMGVVGVARGVFLRRVRAYRPSQVFSDWPATTTFFANCVIM